MSLKNTAGRSEPATNRIEERVRLAATIPRGSFVYDRTLGAFESMPDLSAPNACKTVEAILNESLINTGITVKVNGVYSRQGKSVAAVEAFDGFDSVNTEVKILG